MHKDALWKAQPVDVTTAHTTKIEAQMDILSANPRRARPAMAAMRQTELQASAEKGTK